MEAQLNLFNKGYSRTVNKAELLDKAVLKERINNTHFQSANPSFTIEKWQPGDEQLPMFYTIENTLIGHLLIAATEKGITYAGFVVKDIAAALADLKRRFPENKLTVGTVKWLTIAADRINNPEKKVPLSLHLKGTDFQLYVWKKLILIPFGGLTNYKQLGAGPDSRAVGAAVGANPVGYLVPCHRVIHADGTLSGFFWGREIKAGLLKFEATPSSIIKHHNETTTENRL